MQTLNENFPRLSSQISNESFARYRISKSYDIGQILFIGTVSASSIIRYPTTRTIHRTALSITAERSTTPVRELSPPWHASTRYVPPIKKREEGSSQEVHICAPVSSAYGVRTAVVDRGHPGRIPGFIRWICTDLAVGSYTGCCCLRCDRRTQQSKFLPPLRQFSIPGIYYVVRGNLVISRVVHGSGKNSRVKVARPDP